MDGGSSIAEIAEEINGFSALSGPVTVEGEIPDSSAGVTHVVFKVTFDEKDGDVAQMTAIATTGVVNVGTRRNGWSIEAPVSHGLESMQAGGVVNVTAREQCVFTVSGTDDSTYYFCYDGICGETFVKASGATGFKDSRLTNIKDENGDSPLAGAVAATDNANNPVTEGRYVVNMPMGKSCDDLEMRIHALGTAGDAEITKTTRKQNNGKQFKIKRSFIQSFDEATAGMSAITGLNAAPFVCATTAGSMCFTIAPFIDTFIFSEHTNCATGGNDDGLFVAGVDGGTFPVYRTISKAPGSGAGNLELSAAITDIGAVDTCALKIGRSVITLDSVLEAVDVVADPCMDYGRTGTSGTAGTTEAECHAKQNCGTNNDKQCIWTHQEKTLLYTSPVGSCSVSETTKGTYESYECSNRGACDGKSGLCTCYEGYSGQSCQTQTVLV
jgi:hypothetical protein